MLVPPGLNVDPKLDIFSLNSDEVDSNAMGVVKGRRGFLVEGLSREKKVVMVVCNMSIRKETNTEGGSNWPTN